MSSPDLKRCKRCNLNLPKSEFYPHATNRDRLNKSCKKCIYAQQAVWRANNKERKRRLNESYRIKTAKPLPKPICPKHGDHDDWKHSTFKRKWWCQKCSKPVKTRAQVVEESKARKEAAERKRCEALLKPPPLCPIHGVHAEWKHSLLKTRWWCQKCRKKTLSERAKRKYRRMAAKYCPVNPYRKSSVSDYYARNADRCKKRAIEYWNKRKQSDPSYVLRTNIRHRVRIALRKHPMTTVKLIGCNAGELRAWIERQFTKAMSWKNYGSEWVIDHIHPLASFDLCDKKQLLLASHYTNLRPLLRSKNAEKAANITVPQLPLMLPMCL